MACFDKQICKLCRNSTDEQTITVIEDNIKDILKILLPKLNFEEKGQQVMCNICSVKLLAAFEFKGTCINTDNAIMAYVDSEKMLPLDIRYVYMKETDSKHLMSIGDCQNVCRLCMQLKTGEFISALEINFDLIQSCVPETNFDVTRDPLVCIPCFVSLQANADFLRNSLNAQREIKYEIDDGEIKPEPFLPSYACVKNKEVKVEQETEKLIKSEELQIKSEDSKQESLTSDLLSENEGVINSCDSTYVKELEGSDKSTCKIKNSRIEDKSNLTFRLLKRIEESKMYKCCDCDFETRNKINLNKHQLNHRNASDMHILKCSDCDFETRYKKNLYRHWLNHRDASDVHLYKCNECDYQNKHINNFKKHQLRHKDISEKEIRDYNIYENSLASLQLKHRGTMESRLYKCRRCLYQTKFRKVFKLHLLRHENASEVPMYNCEICNFLTTHKGHYSAHQLKHTVELKDHKCNECDYQTTVKRNLVRHQLKHKSIHEIEMYKCCECDYQTKYKPSLVRHQLKHRKASEVLMYKCDKCDHQTRFKTGLVSHQLIHKDALEEVRIHKCDECDYQTKYKNGYVSHKLRHRNASQVREYKCN